MYSAGRRKITMGFTPPEVTARVIVMIERMRALSKNDPELVRLLAELSPYLPSEAGEKERVPQPLAPLPIR